MASTRPTYHIPFPTSFLAVNTPVKKTVTAVPAAEPLVPAHGFLSNRQNSGRHQSVSSISSNASIGAPPSEASTLSPPSSPTATKHDDSPILGLKIFSPLAVNAKYATPPGSLKEMSAAERQRRMSFERSAFLSNIE
ncbi:hypothetical protein COCCADRAFT_27585 [Bipolaris zeicola 26-R-13]|uniref:Uncharacterized protein n=1 Tax=Cochliobolus carbonum (strain 26-R-13) TaxID=930089 RepID=W6XWJ7_COCC2|nr:uncharacterized protein COCCADRAFT_27585 [Bipolaris zeicola 26-R-13]EUC31792.1 hypothetical protein COCCADRAFT_27585 [Bipolaris zeicola 26-R-13]